MSGVPASDRTAVGFLLHAFFYFGVEVAVVVVRDPDVHIVYLKEIWNHSYHSCNHHWIVRNDSDEVGEVVEDVIYFCRN